MRCFTLGKGIISSILSGSTFWIRRKRLRFGLLWHCLFAIGSIGIDGQGTILAIGKIRFHGKRSRLVNVTRTTSSTVGTLHSSHGGRLGQFLTSRLDLFDRQAAAAFIHQGFELLAVVVFVFISTTLATFVFAAVSALLVVASVTTLIFAAVAALLVFAVFVDLPSHLMSQGFDDGAVHAQRSDTEQLKQP